MVPFPAPDGPSIAITSRFCPPIVPFDNGRV
jgi:hypothetical protein